MHGTTITNNNRANMDFLFLNASQAATNLWRKQPVGHFDDPLVMTPQQRLRVCRSILDQTGATQGLCCREGGRREAPIRRGNSEARCEEEREETRKRASLVITQCA